MSDKIKSPGIIFEVQWRKKSGAGCNEEPVCIGIWEPADTSLDWVTFKSYLSQNLGTMDRISVSYVDTDGDEVPIESECEFQEALKFAKLRSHKGRNTLLKLDRHSDSAPSTQVRQVQEDVSIDRKCAAKEMPEKPFNATNASNQQIFNQQKSAGSPKSYFCYKQVGPLFEDKSTKIKRPIKIDFQKSPNLYTPVSFGKKANLIHATSTAVDSSFSPAVLKKLKPDKEDVPPSWFKKYMQKMKSEIVAEVTANVMHGTRQLLETAQTASSTCMCSQKCGSLLGGKAKKKKRLSDEDTSDCALVSDQREHKLLKKIEKLHKREKKLDSKLEKLETKTKRKMEKKSQAAPRVDVAVEKKLSRKRSSDGPVCPYLMDAILLRDGVKHSDTHVKPGERFTKVWLVMNNGTLPWTDKTELRLTWGTLGLDPRETVVKCPELKPGEKGKIVANFTAPNFPGTFETYWHFYHMGERFGHWIPFTVTVVASADDEEKTPEQLKHRVLGMIESDVADNEEAANASNNNNLDENFNTERTEVALDPTVKPKSDDEEPGVLVMSWETASDSESEMLSMCMGSLGVSSDSEEDNFVVVPMPMPVPACCVPNKSGETSKIDNEEVSKDQASEKRTVTVHDLNSLTVSFPNNQCLDSVKTSNEEVTSAITYKLPGETSKEPNLTPAITYILPGETSKEPNSSQKSNTAFYGADENPGPSGIYAVDMSGHCVPVEHVFKAPETRRHSGSTAFSQSYTSTFQSSASGCADPTFETYHSSFSANSPTENNNTFSSTSFCEFPFEKYNGFKGNNESTNINFNVTKAADPVSCSAQTAGVSVSGRQYPPKPPAHNSSAETGLSGSETQQRSSTRADEARATAGNISSGSMYGKNRSTTNDNAPRRSPPGSPRNPDPAASVHILPETLVTGAISVASSALNTARAVLGNLRTRSPADVGRSTRNVDRSTSDNLALLLEMGFTNTVLNVLLLQRYDNDITKVIAELITCQENREDDGM